MAAGSAARGWHDAGGRIADASGYHDRPMATARPPRCRCTGHQAGGRSGAARIAHPDPCCAAPTGHRMHGPRIDPVRRTALARRRSAASGCFLCRRGGYDDDDHHCDRYCCGLGPMLPLRLCAVGRGRCIAFRCSVRFDRNGGRSTTRAAASPTAGPTPTRAFYVLRWLLADRETREKMRRERAQQMETLYAAAAAAATFGSTANRRRRRPPCNDSLRSRSGISIGELIGEPIAHPIRSAAAACAKRPSRPAAEVQGPRSKAHAAATGVQPVATPVQASPPFPDIAVRTLSGRAVSTATVLRSRISLLLLSYRESGTVRGRMHARAALPISGTLTTPSRPPTQRALRAYRRVFDEHFAAAPDVQCVQVRRRPARVDRIAPGAAQPRARRRGRRADDGGGVADTAAAAGIGRVCAATAVPRGKRMGDVPGLLRHQPLHEHGTGLVESRCGPLLCGGHRGPSSMAGAWRRSWQVARSARRTRQRPHSRAPRGDRHRPGCW